MVIEMVVSVAPVSTNVSNVTSSFKTTTPASASVSTWEEGSSYSDFFIGSFNFIAINLERSFNGNYSFAHDLPNDVAKCLGNLSWCDLYLLLGLSVMWTWLRHIMTINFFQPLSVKYLSYKDER